MISRVIRNLEGSFQVADASVTVMANIIGRNKKYAEVAMNHGVIEALVLLPQRHRNDPKVVKGIRKVVGNNALININNIVNDSAAHCAIVLRHGAVDMI